MNKKVYIVMKEVLILFHVFKILKKVKNKLFYAWKVTAKKALIFLGRDSYKYKKYYLQRKSFSSLHVDGEFYESDFYGNNRNEITLYIVNRLADLICNGSRILDVSCGSGNYLKQLMDKNRDFILEGWDISNDSIENFAKPFLNSAVSLFVIDSEKIKNEFLKVRYNTYDLIICITTIQYFSEKLISKILFQYYQMICVNGLLSIVFPFNSDRRPDWPFKLYKPTELKKLCTNIGFTVKFEEDISKIFCSHYFITFQKN
jgi:SAM-dependent methyltransferase